MTSAYQNNSKIKKNNFKQKNILNFLKTPFLLQKQTCTKE
jgi:hypothetical protein